VAVVTDHDLGARTVVGQEHDQRIFKGTHRTDLVQHPADLAVHAVDKRGVQRHLHRLERSLLIGEITPRQRPVHLAVAEHLQSIREMVRGADPALHLRQTPQDKAEILDPPPPLRPGGLPASSITVVISGDVLGKSLQREVGRVEGEIEEERSAGVFLCVPLEVLDAVVRDGGCRVIPRPRRDRW
jgi:hypothetical protein